MRKNKVIVTLLRSDIITIDSISRRRTDNEELQKALRVLRVLRQQAKKTTGIEDVRPYLWSLLFNLTYRLMYWQTHSDGSQESRARLQQCLVLGGLICRRLEHFETKVGRWPPRDWITAAPAIPLPQRPMLNLQLTDLKNNQQQFKVAVLDVPNRVPNAISQLPFRGDGLVAVTKLLEQGRYQPDRFDPAQTAALKQLGLLQDDLLVYDWCDRIGDYLFKALVPAEGGVRTEFENILRTERKGGELQIIFDKDATGLACQPWEMIHDGYSKDPRTPIDVVRYIASERMAQELEVPAAPCHLLYVAARPRQYAQAAQDRDAIEHSFTSAVFSERFMFSELAGRTHQALMQRLRDPSQPPVHVLHFDGHGTFARLCPKCGMPNQPHQLICANEGCDARLSNTPVRGYLLFENDGGDADFVDTVRFMEGIQRSEVRLVVLSSCHSARVRGADLLLAGVGPGLILAGVPAVVAMQFSISDQDAIKFNQEFYKALAQGDSLPSAVYRARTMLKEPARWSPVLYLRSKDHQIHLCPPK